MKVAELKGEILDYWVARAHGMVVMERPIKRGQPLTKFWGYELGPGVHPGPRVAVDKFRPSSDWAWGGPIIEREKIDLENTNWEPALCYAKKLGDETGSSRREGPTPLIAAMRCFVASKLGDEVEVPEELV